MSCHVMSCHVMSCRHCCINSKKYLSKTFSFHKIIYKYFAGFFACIKSSLRGYCRSNPLYLDCFAHARNDRYKKQSRNDEKNIVITREWNARDICGFQPADAPPLASNPKYMLCFFDNNVASAHCVNNSKRSTQGVRHRRPVGKTSCYKKLDCFTTVRNDGKNIVITRFCKNRSNPLCVDCFAHARTRCAPHGDDDNKNFQFDKFQRLLSVIYKKNSLTKEISK